MGPVCTRRDAILGSVAALIVGGPAVARAAPVDLSIQTKDLGDRVRVKVGLSVNTPAVQLSNRSFGPIYVPKNGRRVVRKFQTAGIVVTIIIVIVGVVMSILTFGILAVGLAAGTEIFRKAISRNISE